MDEWRQRLLAAREFLRENDLHDEVMLNFVQGIGVQDEEPIVPRIWGGSRPGRAPNVDRYRHAMHERMMEDYFVAKPVYRPSLFRRRYRMQRCLLVSIIEKVYARDNYFLQKRDAAGLLGFSPHQKITSALRMLCYGVSADATDEYCKTSESTAMESLRRFCVAIRAEFEGYYLRQPTRNDIEKQLAINEARGFPGMFASLDCMHYQWKNCLVAWQGDFGDRDGNQSIILEAIADGGLHIWHVFFGLLGSNNDLNVLDRSPLIQNLLTSAAHDMTFMVNGCQYNRYYLLTDGIYPPWSCFVQTIHEPQDEKKAHFAKRQEAVRKDVERCFGVLQARFAIISNPSCQWSMEVISDIMFTCCILYNMILEDEEDVEGLEDIIGDLQSDVSMPKDFSFQELLDDTIDIENVDTHFRGDLIEHLWSLKGSHLL